MLLILFSCCHTTNTTHFFLVQNVQEMSKLTSSHVQHSNGSGYNLYAVITTIAAIFMCNEFVELVRDVGSGIIRV